MAFVVFWFRPFFDLPELVGKCGGIAVNWWQMVVCGEKCVEIRGVRSEVPEPGFRYQLFPIRAYVRKG